MRTLKQIISVVAILFASTLVANANVNWDDIPDMTWIHPDHYDLIDGKPMPPSVENYNGGQHASLNGITITCGSGESTYGIFRKNGTTLEKFNYNHAIRNTAFETALQELKSKQSEDWANGIVSSTSSNTSTKDNGVDQEELAALREAAGKSTHYDEYVETKRDEDKITHDIDFNNLSTESAGIQSLVSMGQQQTTKDEGTRDGLISQISEAIESLTSCSNGQKTDGLNEGVAIYDTIVNMRQTMDGLWDKNLSLEYKNVLLADSLDRLNQELQLCTQSAEVNLAEVNEAVKKSPFGNFDEFLNSSKTAVITYPNLVKYGSLEELNADYMAREGRIYVGLYIKDRKFYYQSIEHK